MFGKKGIAVRSHYSNWIIIIVCMALCAVLIGLIVLFYSKYGKSQYSISDADGLVEFMTENSNSASSNAVGNLTTDKITLTKEHLDAIYKIQNQSFEYGAWLYGTLDGHGCTITIEADVTAPLFDKILDGAIVKRINFVCDTILVVDGVNEVALLTKENRGTITDISVAGSDDNSGFTILDFNNNMPIAMSVICVRNYNSIIQCAVKTEVKVSTHYCQTNGQKLSSGTRWDCYFGAIAAYCLEYGNLHGAIVQVKFDDNFIPLLLRRYNEDNDVNNRIGYFVGYAADYTRIDSEAKFYVVDGAYADNVTDYCYLPQNKLNKYSSIYSSVEAIPSLWNGWERADFPKVAKQSN